MYKSPWAQGDMMGIIFKNGDGEYQCGVLAVLILVEKKGLDASLNVKNSFK